MALAELLDRMAHDPDCTVIPPKGQPTLGSAYIVPEDVQAFYEVCGGLVIARGSPYEVRIVSPDECVPANDVILGASILGDLAATVRDQLSGNASWDWYIIAEVENANLLAINLGGAHNGNCYDAFWETYASPGQMPVVATSFTGLIEHLYETKGQHWYWLQPGFVSLGDAYD